MGAKSFLDFVRRYQLCAAAQLKDNRTLKEFSQLYYKLYLQNISRFHEPQIQLKFSGLQQTPAV